MAGRITIPKDKVERFCRENHICSLSLFGSVLREEFRPDSDIDVLVEFEEAHQPDLFKVLDMQDRLSAIFGHKVDLVERKAVEKSENYIRRRHILESAETVYVAR